MLPCLPEVSTPRISIDRRLIAGSHQFNQHAGTPGGMNKYVAVATSPDLDFLGDESCAAGFQSLDSSLQIGDANRDMVKTLAALGDKFGNHRIIRSRFEKFQPGFADRNHYDTDFFTGDNFLGGKR